MPIEKISPHQIGEDVLRRLLYDLEAIIEILRSQTQQFDIALRGLNAAQVIMSPRSSQTVIVATPALPAVQAPTLLVENTVLNLMQVTFVNDDFAIPVYISDKDVVIPAGDLLDPRQRLTYNLRRGQKKYALGPPGTTVNIIVNESESALASVTTDLKDNTLDM
jgi:hypothetical protein